MSTVSHEAAGVGVEGGVGVGVDLVEDVRELLEDLAVDKNKKDDPVDDDGYISSSSTENLAGQEGKEKEEEKENKEEEEKVGIYILHSKEKGE